MYTALQVKRNLNHAHHPRNFIKVQKIMLKILTQISGQNVQMKSFGTKLKFHFFLILPNFQTWREAVPFPKFAIQITVSHL